MTSRERVLKACSFEETDRVPIDIGGTQVSGICIAAADAAYTCGTYPIAN